MLEFRQVSKRHGAQVVLDGGSLRVSAGERVGIVGPNGAGKSTLFELIAGGMAPDSGTVAVHPGLRIGWLQQQVPAADLEVPLLRHAVTAAPDLEEIRAETARLEAEAERADCDGDARRLLRRLGELQAAFEAAGGYGRCATSRAAGACARSWPAPCSRSRTCCSWTSRATTWTCPRWSGFGGVWRRSAAPSC